MATTIIARVDPRRPLLPRAAPRALLLLLGGLAILCLGLLLRPAAAAQTPAPSATQNQDSSATNSNAGTSFSSGTLFPAPSNEEPDHPQLEHNSWLATGLLPVAAIVVTLVTIALGGGWAYSERRRTE